MPAQRPYLEHDQRYNPMAQRQTRTEGRRGPWSPTEDKLLKELVEQHGAGNWVAIQNGIQSRTAKQCRERWHQNLDPKLNHDPITAEEGAKIDELVEKMGKRWADIARHLNGRSDNAVKNWWNGGENRRRREQSRVETTLYSPRYAAPTPHYWPQQSHHYYPQPQAPVMQQPQPVYERLTLAPITSPVVLSQSRGIPAPISVSTSAVPRDIPSPAYSMQTMTEDPASPRSYTRRDSIPQLAPVQSTSGSEPMIRSPSGSSSTSSPIRPETIDKRTVSPCTESRMLPGINTIFSGPPQVKELSHLINPSPSSYSPHGQTHSVQLPSLSTINRF